MNQLLIGWAMFFRHHGKIHYLNSSWTSVCGYWKVRSEEQNKVKIVANPRPSKICSKCLVRVTERAA